MIESITNMNLEDYRNVAIILGVGVGVAVALIVYMTNSYYQYKQRTSDNANRNQDVHSKLFKNEFLKKTLTPWKMGALKEMLPIKI